MAENQEHSTTSAKGQSDDTCHPCPPYPLKPDYNVPEYKEPEEWSDYKKIPDHVKEETKAARETARRKADDKLAESIQKADDVRKEANLKLELAEAKYESATKVLCDKTKNAKEELWPVYTKCIRDSLPNNCTKIEDAPEDKQAVCTAQLKLNLLAEDLKFKTELQKLDKTRLDAQAESEKAEQQYSHAISAANDEQKKAHQDAEVKYIEAFSKALEKVC